MILDINNLPSDTNILHQIVADLVSKVISLEEQLILLKRQRFGQSSEKLDTQIAELETKIEEGELLDAASDITKEQEASKDGKTTKANAEPKNTPKRMKSSVK